MTGEALKGVARRWILGDMWSGSVPPAAVA